MEVSCKLEGMLQSVTRKQRELQKQLDEINRLARGLREQIVLEHSQPEQHPVITAPKNAQIVDGHLVTIANSHLATVQDDSQPSTPTKYKTVNESSPQSVGVQSTDSTQVELGAPRTPGAPPSSAGPFLDMEHGSTNSHHYDSYVHSPAHSCPMPTADTTPHPMDQPFIDGSPTGLPRYRINSDDDLYGLSWAGALGCGTTLFGERLLESSRRGNSRGNILGNDILALSFDEHSLLDNASTRNRVAALAASAGVGSQDSPLRSGGSFDGVNFRTGMSGHRGLNQPITHAGSLHASSASMPRRQVRMMSEHRGVAAARGTATHGLKRRTLPDGTMIDY